MALYTVSCSCGRTMTPDGRAGRGAYRCGCGMRIRIAVHASPKGQCVGTHRGEPCRIVVSHSEPFPLCESHYESSGLKEYHFWRLGAPEEIRREISDRVVNGIRAALAKEVEEAGYKKVDNRYIRADKNPIVYFIRSGNLVKIGTTIDLIGRMKSFNLPDLVVLATEPGYWKREREIHLQFAELRHEREWFRLEGPLVDYINGIRAQHGVPALVL
ncbi:GIY-YIG nuclease family protein [Streptomyces sp. NPDC051310]|uniref:GIY-YIG nuclease family protein n=1 Tax=Streptomyces sp. NPDC051310 TaxID=3365649 RepID=UPI0037A4A7EB